MNFKKILTCTLISVFLCCLFPYNCFATSSFIWSDASSVQLLETNSISNSADLNLQSDGAVLIEQSTGTVLYEHNSHEMFRPASVTKVMSLLLIMEAVDSRCYFFR